MAFCGQRADVLMLHLLGKCNLECAHCYMEGSPSRRERLPLENVLAAVEECDALGIGSVSLTGGEPLLYPHLARVLDALAKLPKIRTTVCTNATLMTTVHAVRLRECGARINVSIDGPPDFHDDFRRSKGAFAAAEAGVRLAVGEKVPLTVIATISRRNLDALEFLVTWATDVGAEHFFAQPLLQLGRGKDIVDDCLSFHEVNRLILGLSDLANREKHRRLRCQIIGAKKQFLLEHPCGAFVRKGVQCHRGASKEIRKLVIREDGTVLPEIPGLDPRFALGRLQDGSLRQMIDHYFDNGFDEFEKLCRETYQSVLPTWDCAIVPWEQIVSARSESWLFGDGAQADHSAVCAASKYGSRASPEAASFR